MAHSISVLVDGSQLPKIKALAEQLETGPHPITLNTEWDWRDQSGWLPMTWRNRDTGCEVDVEPLSQEESGNAAKEGFPDLDTAVVITSRGWGSLRVAVAFSAAVAVMSGGCVSEDDGDYLSHSSVERWAKDTLNSADKAEKNTTASEKNKRGLDSRRKRGEAAESGRKEQPDYSTDKGLVALTDTFIEPTALAMGFVRLKTWEFARVRGEMIDVLTIVRMRRTQFHYCGFFTNLLCDPFGGVLTKIRAGKQPTNNIDTGFRWEATDERSHKDVFSDIQAFLAGHVSEFFDRMTVRGYLEHIRFTGSMYRQSECMCLALLDESLELIPELCARDREMLAKRSVDDYTAAAIEKRRKIFTETERAYESGALSELIRLRKCRNLKEAKLHSNFGILEQANIQPGDFELIEN